MNVLLLVLPAFNRFYVLFHLKPFSHSISTLFRKYSTLEIICFFFLVAPSRSFLRSIYRLHMYFDPVSMNAIPSNFATPLLFISVGENVGKFIRNAII